MYCVKYLYYIHLQNMNCCKMHWEPQIYHSITEHDIVSRYLQPFKHFNQITRRHTSTLISQCIRRYIPLAGLKLRKAKHAMDRQDEEYLP